MKTYKYPFYAQSNCIRLGNLLDDMWQVHEYFHKWQRQRYKDRLPYAGYEAMCLHVTELKRTTHPHWISVARVKRSRGTQANDLAYDSIVFKKLGLVDRSRETAIEFTCPSPSNKRVASKTIACTLNGQETGITKWRQDKVAYTFHKHFCSSYGNVVSRSREIPW